MFQGPYLLFFQLLLFLKEKTIESTINLSTFDHLNPATLMKINLSMSVFDLPHLFVASNYLTKSKNDIYISQ